MAKTKSQSTHQGKRKAPIPANAESSIDTEDAKPSSKRYSSDASEAKSSSKRSAQATTGSTKRSNPSDSVLSAEKPRRSKRVKQQHLDLKQRDTIITPSPAFLHQAKAKVPGANVQAVAADLHLAREGITSPDLSKSRKPSTSSLSSLSSICSKLSKDVTVTDQDLPPGVHSILCPFMKERTSIRRMATASKKDAHKLETNMNSCNATSNLAPCACAFTYNDSSGIVNIESYLATYSREYIASLYENEFNIEYVPNNFFPAHLRKGAGDDASSASESNISASIKSSDEGSDSDSSRFSPAPEQRRRSPRFLQDGNSNDDKNESGDDDSASVEASNAEQDSDASCFCGDDVLFTAASQSSDASSSSFSCTQSQASSTQSKVDTLSKQRFQYYMNYITRIQQQRRVERKSGITSQIRAVLVDWLIEVAEEYRLGGVTLQTAVGLVDRCLANENCRLVKDLVVEKWKNDLYSDSDDDSTDGANRLYKGQRLLIDRKTVQLLGW